MRARELFPIPLRALLSISMAFFRSTSCANVRSVGFTGARMFRINWYVVGPHTLSRMARCLSADVTSLAVKYWASRSEYDFQSSDGPVHRHPRVYSRRQYCIRTSLILNIQPASSGILQKAV